MKNIKIIVCLILFIGITENGLAMKFKIKGSGGIVIKPDGSQKICPNESDNTCAIIECSLWQAIKLKWEEVFGEKYKYPYPNNGELDEILPINGTIEVYDENMNIILNSKVTIVNLKEPPIIKSEEDVLEIKSSTIELIIK